MTLEVTCYNCDKEMEEVLEKVPLDARKFVCDECAAAVWVKVIVDDPEW